MTSPVLTQALEALELAVLQNGCDMLLTGEELRILESAIASLRAADAGVQPAMGQVAAFKASLLAYADEAYCTSLRMFRADPCLGLEAKMKAGRYGSAEHEAHRKANEKMGAHRGIYEAVKLAEAAISASPAAPEPQAASDLFAEPGPGEAEQIRDEHVAAMEGQQAAERCLDCGDPVPKRVCYCQAGCAHVGSPVVAPSGQPVRPSREWYAAMIKQTMDDEPGIMAAGALVADADRMRALVDRFLAWKLPDSFSPDCYISFDREKAENNLGWPIGTNLLTATEARQMLEHVLAGLTIGAAPSAQQPQAAGVSERLERAISGLDYFLTNKAERRFIEGARNELAEMRPLLPITEIEREPAGWLVSFDGSVWEYCASDPEGFIGDRACIVRPIAFADGCNWGVLSSPAVQGEAAQQPPAPAAPGVPADAGREEQR